MKKCEICGTKLNDNGLGIDHIFSIKEKRKLRGLRKDQTICADCKIQMLILNITSK